MLEKRLKNATVMRDASVKQQGRIRKVIPTKPPPKDELLIPMTSSPNLDLLALNTSSSFPLRNQAADSISAMSLLDLDGDNNNNNNNNKISDVLSSFPLSSPIDNNYNNNNN